MQATIYINTTAVAARDSTTSTACPSVTARLQASLDLTFYFFTEGAAAAALAGSPTFRVAIKDKDEPTGSVLVLDTSATTSGAGYVFSFASVDSAALRTLLADNVSVDCMGEIEWTVGAVVERVHFPVLVQNAWVQSGDDAPDPIADASWTWLKLRAPEANGFTHDDVGQELTVAGGAGSGDVVGPASSVDSRPALFNGTTGKLLKQGSAALGDAAYKNTGSTAGTLAAGDDARMTNARTPTAHASTHLTGGADAIQAATASQPGLATAAQITKLDGIEALADVTDAGNVAAAGAAMKSVYDSQNLGLITGLQGSGEFIGAAFSGGSGGQLNMAGGNGGEFAAGSAGSINTSGGSGSGVIQAGGSGGNILTYGGDDGQSGGSINTSNGGGSIDTSNGGGSITTNGTGSINLGSPGTRTTLVGSATAARTITLPNVTGTVISTGDTGTVTNTMLAGSIDLSTKVTGTLDLTTKVTGALPIANGGTGQTTAVAAFDALAPTTTKGDLIVSNGTDNIRVAVGATNGHVLTVDSAEASGVKWAAASGGASEPLFISKTDTETLNASTWTDIAGLSLSFTAASITQKILVRACVLAGNPSTATVLFRLVNEDGTLLQGSAAGSRLQAHAFTYINSAGAVVPATFEVVYTPGTTSARTYKVQWYRQGSATIYINRSVTDTDSATFSRTASTLFLQAF